MTFPRVAILQRLVEIAGTIPGIKTVSWDVISINDDQLPAIMILEGDEETSDEDPAGSRPTFAPRRVTMVPHVVIAAGRNIGSPPLDIGPALNTFYAAVVKAVLTDATLASHTFNGRGARLLGMESDLAVGRMMQGQMAVKFGFTYGLVPNNL